MVRDPRSGHNRKQIDENFFKTWSFGMSYVLGFLFADGALLDTNTSSRTYYVSFANNDLPLLAAMRDLMKSDHKIYICPPRIMKPRGIEYLSKTGYVLRIGNKIIHQDLLNLGLESRKSNVMHLPDVPDKYFSYFLRGYFDGDGCVNIYLRRRRITADICLIFTSGSLVYLQELSQRLATLLNIKPPGIYQSMGAHNLSCKGYKAIRILEYMYQGLENAPYLKRKYDKYTNYVAEQMGSRLRQKLMVA